MKTDDLIRSLAQDNVLEARAPRRAASLSYPFCLAVLAVLFVALLGPRPGFGSGGILLITAMKLAVTVTLAVAGVAAVLKAAAPDVDPGDGWRAAAPAAAVLAAMLVYDFATHGAGGWLARLTGLHGLRCLTIVSLLSIVPLATALYVLQHGAVTRPTLAGAVAGLAATGIGASFYALNCTDDSPLFMLAWYGPATLVVIALGILGAYRFLRW
jgi:hypothetical protein